MPGAGRLFIANSPNFIGLYGGDGLQFAINGGYASPSNFALGSSIGSSANFERSGLYSSFRTYASYSYPSSPNFGPGSYMGFRTAQNNFGWLGVTWNRTSLDFQILSGAYEDVPGVAILAGASAAPIPEPGTWAALAVFAGGAAFARWRQRRNEAQKEAA